MKVTTEIITCELIKYRVKKHRITTNEEKLVVDSCIVNLLPQFWIHKCLDFREKGHAEVGWMWFIASIYI